MKQNYKKFKISIAKDSAKIQGLKHGDVVMRSYIDSNQNTMHTVMYVLSVGVDIIDTDNSPYFIGALLMGDEPKNGELLDFVRVTSLTSSQRSGAVYMTANDSESPFIDILNEVQINAALSYPEFTSNNFSKRTIGLENESYNKLFWNPIGSNKERVFRIVKSTHEINNSDADRALNPLIFPKLEQDKMYLVCFSGRSKSSIVDTFEIANLDHTRPQISEQVHLTSSWSDFFFVFRASDISTDNYVSVGNIANKELDFWVEYANFGVYDLELLSGFSHATQSRFGKLGGISDKVFGTLEGYGSYIDNLYASGNVNVSGTITAGGKDGFGSNFYAGKISTNIIPNSNLSQWSKRGSASVVVNASYMGEQAFKIKSGAVESDGIYTACDKVSIGSQYVFSAYFNNVLSTNVDVSVYVCGRKITRSIPSGWHKESFPVVALDNRVEIMSTVEITVSMPQLEEGSTATQYQKTDGVLSDDDGYGAWMCKGGVGGTIQNPLLRFESDGSIVGKNRNFVILPNGDATFKGHLEANTGLIAGWNIKSDAIYKDNISIASSGYIKSADTSNTYWSLNNDGSSSFAKGNTLFNADGSASLAGGKVVFNTDGSGKFTDHITWNAQGLLDVKRITANSGTIGGWDIDTTTIWSGSKYGGNKAGLEIRKEGTGTRVLAHAGSTTNYTMLYSYPDSGTWGLTGRVNGASVFEFGSTNQIAGWVFDSETLKGGSTTIYKSGAIVNNISNVNKWRLNSDGSGGLASDNIQWDTSGNVTFSAKVKLNWENYTNTAIGNLEVGARNLAVGTKSIDPFNTVGGIPGIVLSNDSLFQNLVSGDWYLISFNAEPISGDCSLHVEFWGSEGGDVIVSKNGRYGVRTRYKGKNHLYFWHNGNNAAKISRLKIESGNIPTDWTEAPEDHPLTHIDANGIYTGTLTANQVNAVAINASSITTGTLSADRIAAGSLNGNKITAGTITSLGAVTAGSFSLGNGTFQVNGNGWLTSTGGTIGCWTVDGDSMYTGNKWGYGGSGTTLKNGHIGINQNGTSDYVALYQNSESWGFDGRKNGEYVFRLGSYNQIAGWNFNSYHLMCGSFSSNSNGAIYLSNSNSGGSGIFYDGSQRLRGLVQTWHRSNNAGHLVFGQTALNGTSIREGYMGIQMMNWQGAEFFCLAANADLVGSQAYHCKIAGWSFNASQLSSTDGKMIINSSSGINFNNAFKVDADGNLTASSANISGTITATGGTIGIFKISQNGTFSTTSNLQGVIDISPSATKYTRMYGGNIAIGNTGGIQAISIDSLYGISIDSSTARDAMALDSRGGISLRVSSGQHCNIPGVLLSGRLRWGDKGIYNRFGNGSSNPYISTTGKGYWILFHGLGHTDYIAVANPNYTASDNNGHLNTYVRIEDISAYSVKFRMVNADNGNAENANITFALIGRNG